MAFKFLFDRLWHENLILSPTASRSRSLIPKCDGGPNIISHYLRATSKISSALISHYFDDVKFTGTVNKIGQSATRKRIVSDSLNLTPHAKRMRVVPRKFCITTFAKFLRIMFHTYVLLACEQSRSYLVIRDVTCSTLQADANVLRQIRKCRRMSAQL